MQIDYAPGGAIIPHVCYHATKSNQEPRNIEKEKELKVSQF